MRYIREFSEFKNESIDYKFDNDNYEYYVRYSDHIKEDLKRNWSSWNFGGEGFEGTEEELEEVKQNAIDSNGSASFYISGFELWGDDIIETDIRELYMIERKTQMSSASVM